MRIRRRLALIVLLTSSCAGAPPEEDAPDTPALFAPGTISTRGREFATSVSPDGRSVYFNRVDPNGGIPILRSRWKNGAWSEPRPLPFHDPAFRDVDPFVSPDGSWLFFTSDRNETPGVPSPDFDIWVSERDGEEWSAPERLPSPPNSPASEAFVSVTRDGTLYFGSTNTADGVRRILRSPRTAQGYGPPVEVDLGLAPGTAVGNPLVLPDESVLVFTSRDLPGLGAVDLFLSRRGADGAWSPPLRLEAPINSPFSDFAPGYHGRWGALLFTSERPGIVGEGEIDERPPGDLYWVRWP